MDDKRHSMNVYVLRPLLVLLISALLGQSARAQDHCAPATCGQLNDEEYGNFTHLTNLTEYPWIGRLGYETGRGIVYKCLAVLISSRHMLAPAHCFEEKQLEKAPLKYVLLGDWNPSNAYTQRDCDAQQRCNPLPRLQEIDEIIIHPDYHYQSMTNNICVLKLAQIVAFAPHISPICLPPPDANSIGQFLPYAGFAVNSSIAYKVKGLAQVQGTRQCRRTLLGLNYLQAATPYKLNHLCANSNVVTPLITGSPLMGVRLDELEPHSFYLAGLLLITTSSDIPHVFLRVQPYRKWIERSMQCPSTASSSSSKRTTTAAPTVQVVPSYLVRHEVRQVSFP